MIKRSEHSEPLFGSGGVGANSVVSLESVSITLKVGISSQFVHTVLKNSVVSCCREAHASYKVILYGYIS